MGGGGFLGLFPTPDTSAQDRAMAQSEKMQRELDFKNEQKRSMLARVTLRALKGQTGLTYGDNPGGPA